MKATLVPLAFVLLCAFQLKAQTAPKWSFTASAPGSFQSGTAFIKSSAFDGIGGSAWNIQFDDFDDGSRVSTLLWLDGNGRPVYTNTFIGPQSSSISLRIARFTKTELAVQVDATDATGTNYMLRIRKVGARVVTSEYPIGASEVASAAIGNPSDVRGLFTTQMARGSATIRRYTN